MFAIPVLKAKEKSINKIVLCECADLCILWQCLKVWGLHPQHYVLLCAQTWKCPVYQTACRKTGRPLHLPCTCKAQRSGPPAYLSSTGPWAPCLWACQGQGWTLCRMEVNSCSSVSWVNGDLRARPVQLLAVLMNQIKLLRCSAMLTTAGFGESAHHVVQSLLLPSLCIPSNVFLLHFIHEADLGQGSLLSELYFQFPHPELVTS